MMLRTLFTIALVAGLPLALAACDQKPATVYKQGTYSGKVDSNPWDNERFKGDKVEWEKTIKARNQQQNEYSRTVATAAK